MHKIVILDGHALNPGDLNWDALRALGPVTVHERTPQELIVERCREAEIVLTNKVPLLEESLDQLPALRYIGVMATGYNVIDVEAAHRRGIVVTNIPAYSTPSVAQCVFALLLAMTNRVEHYTQQIVQEGSWTHSPDFCYWDTPLTELCGQRMGIVGMGAIGSRVAAIAQALGMEVVALSRRGQEAMPAGVLKVDEDTFWRTSHVVSLHCPLTPSTHHLVNARVLALMPQGALLINTSRGPVVDDEAVAEALHAGRLGGYAADVLSQEPPPASHPLLTAPRVFLTPHIAWATRQARERLLHTLVGNVKAYMEDKPVNTV